MHFKYDSVEDIRRAVDELYDMVATTKELSDMSYNSETNYNLLMDIYANAQRIQ